MAGVEKAVRLGVLVSGGGTTLQNFFDKIEKGTLNAEIACVISSSPGAYALERAAKHGVPATALKRAEYNSVEEYSDAIFETLDSHGVELVTLAGFLKLIRIPPAYIGRVMNIHPALIPAFCGDGLYGMKVHTTVVERGVKISGCTVHFADNIYDNGPIIVQKAVPVYDTDSPEDIQKRVFEKEMEAYPEAINLYAAGRLRIEGRRVIILPA
jgi:formyltetrahydrofolate-dependent phosphoribosylglycinamide formyltransferase